jgi:predicted outer membrane repeat protein
MIKLLFAISVLCYELAESHHVDIMTHSRFCGSENHTILECATLPQCLSRIAECVLDNTTLSLQSGFHSTDGLSGLIEIRNIIDLQIQGHDSVIDCHGNVGFMLRRMDRLLIRELNFHNCGTIFKPRVVSSLIPSLGESSQSFWWTRVAVIVADSFDVLMEEVRISNSSGYGLFAVNLLGSSNLHEITVSRSNYGAIGRYEHNFDLCMEPENTDCSGGNVVLLYEQCSICSSGPHHLVVSQMVVEHGVSLERWDVGTSIEVAGGLTISPKQLMQYFVTIVVQDSILTSNIGRYAGNSAVMLYSTSCQIVYQNTSFLNGNAELSYYADRSFAGGLYAVWGQVMDDEPFTKYLLIDNCTFANNSALFGGAIYMSTLIDDELVEVMTLNLLINDSDIRENHGYSGIVRVSGARTEETVDSINHISVTVKDTRIYNNRLLTPTNNRNLGNIGRWEFFSNSALYCNNQRNLTLSNIKISDNHIRGLDISSTRQFRFSGENHITGNTAVNGGGIQLFKSSFLVLPNSILYITHNQATGHGGGIYIREDASNICFFQVYNVTDTQEPRIVMRENSANLSGNSIFGGNIDSCQLERISVSGLDSFYGLFSVLRNRSLTEITSNTRQLCFCREHRPACDIKSEEVSTFPGQGFSVVAVAIGQLNGTTVDTALTHVSNSLSPISLGQQQDAQELSTVCTQLNFTLSSGEDQVTLLGLQTNYGKTRLPNSILLSVEVHTMPCPMGFSLHETLMVCDCNKYLNSFGVKCFINQKDNIQSPFTVWIGHDSETNLLLAHKSCPLHLCKSEKVNFTLDTPDLQCQDGRYGVLCGGCRENLSTVFGTSTCKPCSNNYLALLAVFSAAGLLLTAAMIYGDLTLSRGSFNGLIFYANIVRIHHAIIFPPNNVNLVTVFIAWLNLDLGIEVCFYHGMDAYAQTWLQYLFPAYVWMLVIAVIFAGWHSKRAATVFGSNAVQVMATLLLLSYTKIQRIVLETWSSTLITHENGSFSVWLHDGNVPFLKGKHIWLSLMSLIVTAGFLIPFTLILLCEYPLQAKFSTLMLRYKLTPLIDVYQGPYKVQFRWWSGVLLLVRGAVLLAYGLNVFGDPRLNLILVTSMCVVILGLMWNVGTIYKERYINIIESFFLVNLGLLSVWTLFNRYSSSNFFLQQTIVSYTLVGSSLLVFIAIVIGQIYFRLKGKFGRNEGSSPSVKCEQQVNTESDAYRESLLF